MIEFNAPMRPLRDSCYPQKIGSQTEITDLIDNFISIQHELVSQLMSFEFVESRVNNGSSKVTLSVSIWRTEKPNLYCYHTFRKYRTSTLPTLHNIAGSLEYWEFL